MWPFLLSHDFLCVCHVTISLVTWLPLCHVTISLVIWSFQFHKDHIMPMLFILCMRARCHFVCLFIPVRCHGWTSPHLDHPQGWLEVTQPWPSSGQWGSPYPNILQIPSQVRCFMFYYVAIATYSASCMHLPINALQARWVGFRLQLTCPQWQCTTSCLTYKPFWPYKLTHACMIYAPPPLRHETISTT